MLKHLIDRPVAVTMVLLSIVTLGLVSLSRLPVSLIPDVDIPYVTVQITAGDMSARELDETVVKRATLFALSKLKEEANDTQGIALKVIGAAPAAVARVSGKYRYRIVMKCRMNAPFRTMLSAVLRHCQKSRECSNVTMFADVNGEIL